MLDRGDVFKVVFAVALPRRVAAADGETLVHLSRSEVQPAERPRPDFQLATQTVERKQLEAAELAHRP